MQRAFCNVYLLFTFLGISIAHSFLEYLGPCEILSVNIGLP